MNTLSAFDLGSIPHVKCSSEMITLNSDSSGDSRGFVSTVIPESIAPPSPTSMAEYLQDINTPERASVMVSSDGGEAVYAALSEMWDDGEVILRAMRVTAPENSMDMAAIRHFFLYFAMFIQTLAAKWDRRARRNVTRAAEEFKEALSEANDYASIIRAVDSGYEFRNACFENLSAHSHSMDDTISTLSSSEHHAECLMLLSRGLSGNKVSKCKWVFNTLTVNWTQKIGILQWALSTKRAQRKIVLACANKADKFIAQHIGGGTRINRLRFFFS